MSCEARSSTRPRPSLVSVPYVTVAREASVWELLRPGIYNPRTLFRL